MACDWVEPSKKPMAISLRVPKCPHVRLIAERASWCVGAEVISIRSLSGSPESGHRSVFGSGWPGSYRSPVRIPFNVSILLAWADGEEDEIDDADALWTTAVPMDDTDEFDPPSYKKKKKNLLLFG